MKGVDAAIDALAAASPVSVTCSPTKGVQATLDLTARLLDLGHDAVPHVSARLFEGPHHVRALTEWIHRHGLRELFVIAGDCEHPRGPYADSLSFLRELLELGPRISRIGVPAYPDGHPFVDAGALRAALHAKQAMLTDAGVRGSVTTQMCLDPESIRSWLEEERTSGLLLPVDLGVPGVVERAKLMTMGVRLGIGTSLRFLRKHRSTLMTMLAPGGYDPTELVSALADDAARLRIAGLHAFTFNRVETTRAWQERVLAVVSSVDAIVIGAGVIGSSVALELARGGRSVVCVDKGPAAGAGSTSASSSIIRYSYSTRDAVLTAWESAASWRDWSGHLGVEDPDGLARFVPAGYLNLCTTGYDGTVVMALWDELGIPYEWYDAAQLREQFPGLDIGRFYPPKRIDDPDFAADPDGELTAFYNGDSGYIDDPMLAAHNLAHAARHHGAEFQFRQTVVEIGRRGGHVTGVRLASGQELEAPVVVNVGGPHSAIINRMAGVVGEMRIGHRPLRQEVYAVPAPAGFGLDEGGPIVADLDLGQYFRPQHGGTLLVGGTEPECDVLEWIDDPDDFLELPTVDHWETSMLRLARRLPEFGVPPRPVGLAALYDASDDWVPIYDGSSLGGFYMACGTSGNQFKNAPLAGQFIRALIDAADDGIDHDRDPVQFPGPQTGRSINLGAFSRRRNPAVTSGTVMG